MKYTEFQQRFVSEIEKVNALIFATVKHCPNLKYNWCACLTETREEAIALNEKLVFETDFPSKTVTDNHRIGARHYSANREQSEWSRFSLETKRAKENKLNLINK